MSRHRQLGDCISPTAQTISALSCPPAVSSFARVTESGKGFSCSQGEPSQRSFRRDTPSGSQADENDEARRRGVLLANACGSGAKDDHLASVSGALRDGVRSSRRRSARPSPDPDGRHTNPTCQDSVKSCPCRLTATRSSCPIYVKAGEVPLHLFRFDPARIWIAVPD